MPDVNEMVIFAQVAKEGSFTRAAKLLQLQKSNVSRKIALLEERLDIRLLERTTRSVTLTDAGQIYFEHCLRVLEEIEAANLAVAQMQTIPTGTLRISAPVALGVSVLALLVTDFLKHHKKINIELILNDSPVNMLDSGIDLAFGAGPIPGANYVSKEIGYAQWVLCSSPEYLKKAGTPKQLNDLTQHSTILFSSLNRPNSWTFLGPGGKKDVIVTSSLTVNDLTAVQQATLAGLGIAILPALSVTEDIKAQRLVQLFPEWQLKSYPFYMVYPSSRHLSAKLRAFLEFIMERWSPTPPWAVTLEDV